MDKSISSLQYKGFIFTSIAGTLLHFAYDWSNQSIFLAPFSAINESIWEHMKLLFFPMFVFALIEYFLIGNEYKNFWCSKLIGLLLGLLIIPTLYYTYTGALGVKAEASHPTPHPPLAGRIVRGLTCAAGKGRPWN